MTPLSWSVPSPLEYFASLVADDQHFPLLEAAVSVAQDDEPLLDVQAVLSEVDRLAGRLRARLPADASPLRRLRHLNRYFFEELGFACNLNHYHDPRNSHLHQVLATRRGIPITLALLYCELATQLGLTARGVCFPGHFMVKLRLPQGEVVLDPVNGHSLSREDLEARLQPLRQAGRGGFDEDEPPLGLFLRPATPREVLARLLRNLKHVHREAQDWTRLLAVQRRMVLLLPSAHDERRDRGLVHAALGQRPEAQADLQAYLAAEPDAPDAVQVRARLAELGLGPAGPARRRRRSGGADGAGDGDGGAEAGGGSRPLLH